MGRTKFYLRLTEPRKLNQPGIQPTFNQLKAFYRISVGASSMLVPINLVRLDERTKRLVLLIGETIEIQIRKHGAVTID